MIEEKQIFTRREIETDLKNYSKFNIKWMIVCFVIIVLTTLIIYPLILNAKNGQTAFILILIMNVIFLALVIYLLYKHLRPIEYEIASGEYESQRLGRRGGIVLSFKLYGEYFLTLDNRFHYYNWSEAYSITGTGIHQVIRPGDEYYLIMVNNKIAYIYSKRVFKFKETT